VLAILFMSAALAADVRIEAARTLFLSGDGGTVVLEGDPVVLVYDGRRIEAKRVVYDRRAKVLRLSGQVRYTDTDGRTIEAESLVLALEAEALIAVDLKLEDQGLEFRAPSACKNEGQIKLEQSYFSPCLPCGQDPPDYAFFARKVVIYPGDRIVAKDVWVEVGGERKLHLPLLVLHTSSRKPRIALGFSASDGFTLEADLPYVTESGLGFTLIRYFARRGLGLGVDHWEVEPQKGHLRVLYLPPRPGESQGLWQLLAEWKDTEKGWKQDFNLERDDTRVPGRFYLSVSANLEKTRGNEPQVRFTLKHVLDTDPRAPPIFGVQKLELELDWKKVVQTPEFSAYAHLTLGAYEAASNWQNRSARAKGKRIQAARVKINHHEQYQKQLLPHFSLSASNEFSGYYYSTAEIQIDWNSRIETRYRKRPLEAGIRLTREVQEGETPFAFDRLPTRRKATVVPYLRYQPKPLRFSVEGGYEFFQRRWLPLKGRFELNDPRYRLNLRLAHNLETNHPERIDASFSISLYPLSLWTQTGYSWGEDRFDPWVVRLSYALPGGAASLSTRFDLKARKWTTTRAAVALREGEKSLALTASYDHRRELFLTTTTFRKGPYKLGLALRYPRPDGVPDAEDPEEGHLSGRASLVYRSHRLELAGSLYAQAVEKATLALYSSENRLRGRWNLAAKVHLPSQPEPRLYLADFSLRGAIELSPAFAVQGTLTYHDDGEQKTISFRNFGATVRLYKAKSTRAFLSVFLTQTLDLTSDAPNPLMPRFLLTYDRCCWAFQFELDAQKEEVRFSLIYMDKPAHLRVNRTGVSLPGGISLP